MKKKIFSKVWIALILVVVIAVAVWLLSGGKKEEQINFKQEKVATHTLQNSITATGTIEAVTSVTVGTQVSGIVNKLYVDYNSVVKKGQVIAELDKTNLISELNTAKANLASTESNLSYQSANMKRYQTLYKKGLVSADEYENALLAYRQAKEHVDVQRENKTLATITFQNYFRLYDKLSGMTGTAVTEEEEFASIYKLDIVEIPTNKPVARIDQPDVVYKTEAGKDRAIIDQIIACHEKGQP